VVFLFVYEISPELLNGCAPNSHGRCVWSLAWTSLKVNVTRDKKMAFLAFLMDCVQFMFGKTSLASNLFIMFISCYSKFRFIAERLHLLIVV